MFIRQKKAVQILFAVCEFKVMPQITETYLTYNEDNLQE